MAHVAFKGNGVRNFTVRRGDVRRGIVRGIDVRARAREGGRTRKTQGLATQAAEPVADREVDEVCKPLFDVSRLHKLVAKIEAATTAEERLEDLLSDPRTSAFLATEAGQHYWKLVQSTFSGAYDRYLCLTLPAAGQEHVCICCDDVKGRSAIAAERLTALCETLRRVEVFYSAIGGVLGYQLQVMKLIWAQGTPEDCPDNILEEVREAVKSSPSEGLGASQVRFHLPPGPDLSRDEAFAARAAQWGVAALPCVGEVLPLGGAGDRLGLIDERTGEPLPAAMLPYAGRCMLEHLLRDVQAREYLHFKVHGAQHVTPIAIMTSDAKGNHERVSRLIEDRGYFGRPKSSFRLVKQPSVPLVCGQDGKWIVDKNTFNIMLKPGGHGALWKLLQDEGVLSWLEGQNRHAVVVRQVSNPLASTDTTLLALAGYGARHGKSFGFASCPRAVGANEGMNVLVERVERGRYTYGVSNIEYTEFEKYGLTDDSRADGSVDESGRAVSKFPANTNVLYVALPAVREVLSRMGAASLPGMIINLKKKVKWTDTLTGETFEEHAGRLECTMQNLADGLGESAVKPLVGRDGNAIDASIPSPQHTASDGAEQVEQMDPRDGLKRLDQLGTFVIYNERRKVTSSAKKARDPNSKRLAQTPDGSFCDLQRNAAELLQRCGMKIPEPRDHEEYLAKGGPAMIFLYHPSLGPIYDVIRQKIRGGEMAEGSELVLEVAETQLINLQVNGSLHISCDNIMGHMEPCADGSGKMLVFDSQQCGRVRMRHVRVENAGIDHAATSIDSGDYWKHRPARLESCRIVLHGNSEFEAVRCTISGNMSFEVPNGYKMLVTADGEGGIVRTLEPLAEGGRASWGWEYELRRDGRLGLKMRKWPGAIRRAKTAVQRAVGGVASRIKRNSRGVVDPRSTA